MRRLGLFLFLFLLPAAAVPAASARVIKVLPHFLDQDGRHSLLPSLYERDAYQAYLRKTPAARSGLRFDVQWKGRGLQHPKVRVELRGSAEKNPTTALIETGVSGGRLASRWSAVTLRGPDYTKFGELIAWRLTVWDGDQQIAEQKSFLW